jgi:hypothetical protein
VKFINGLKGANELSLVENMLSPQVLIGGPNVPNKIYVHYGFGCFLYFDKNNNIILKTISNGIVYEWKKIN